MTFAILLFAVRFIVSLCPSPSLLRGTAHSWHWCLCLVADRRTKSTRVLELKHRSAEGVTLSWNVDTPNIRISKQGPCQTASRHPNTAICTTTAGKER